MESTLSNYNPIQQTSLIKPLDTREFTTNWINTLYHEEQLTQDEYLVLDYINEMKNIKSIDGNGSMIMSFQGLKRLMSLHQAKLTKALNRLAQKDLLIKVQGGYIVTPKGLQVHNKLQQLSSTPQVTLQRLPSKLYSHVVEGDIQGPILNRTQYDLIIDRLIGKWFDNFRFTSMIDYSGSYELSWVTTDGKASLSLLIGPNNKIRITHSSSRFRDSVNKMQILIDMISHVLETSIDAPVILTGLSIYENRRKLDEDEFYKIPFAG